PGRGAEDDQQQDADEGGAVRAEQRQDAAQVGALRGRGLLGGPGAAARPAGAGGPAPAAEGHQTPWWRATRWAAAWARGRTVTRSRLMWCGAVRASEMTSAQSSAVSGCSTPS